MPTYAKASVGEGGERGIRTPDTIAGITVFETAPFNHSGISPIKIAGPGRNANISNFFDAEIILPHPARSRITSLNCTFNTPTNHH
jgi:hypothetical protein